jgi:hypothetical protein
MEDEEDAAAIRDILLKRNASGFPKGQVPLAGAWGRRPHMFSVAAGSLTEKIWAGFDRLKHYVILFH